VDALTQAASGAAGRGRRVAWLLMVGALGAFLLVDFTGASFPTAWILTRFLEVPYYGLLGLVVIAFVGAARSKMTKWTGIGVLALWSTVPIAVNIVPLQLLKNAEWLARMVFDEIASATNRERLILGQRSISEPVKQRPQMRLDRIHTQMHGPAPKSGRGLCATGQ
jgi:hypothetical protein